MDIGDLKGVALTNMALQKLVYLAHGWRLIRGQGPIAVNHFEAWEMGPVVRCLYDALKVYGDKPVEDRAKWFNALDNRIEIARVPLVVEERAFLMEMFEKYGRLSAFRLSDLTHAKGGPWDRVWNAGPGEIYFDQRISNEVIAKYFTMHVDNV
ncbi:Panacea domain-containing protein [Reyranella sp.]|uniref:Panacea domain-containing protein n=1 Tax=Reyranella sp. TaxID=1929291 RepID=UPI0037850B57